MYGCASCESQRHKQLTPNLGVMLINLLLVACDDEEEGEKEEKGPQLSWAALTIPFLQVRVRVARAQPASDHMAFSHPGWLTIAPARPARLFTMAACLHSLLMLLLLVAVAAPAYRSASTGTCCGA